MSSTADRLLDVAEGLVQRRGYHAFSYADIAKAVGIKTSSIHYHFPTKEDLVCALVVRYRQRFGEQLEALSSAEADPLIRIERYTSLFRRTFAEDGRICVCASLAVDALTLNDVIGQEIRGFFEDNQQWLLETLEEAKAAGRMRPELAPDLTALAMISSLEGSMLAARVAGTSKPIDDMAVWFRTVLT